MSSGNDMNYSDDLRLSSLSTALDEIMAEILPEFDPPEDLQEQRDALAIWECNQRERVAAGEADVEFWPFPDHFLNERATDPNTVALTLIYGDLSYTSQRTALDDEYNADLRYHTMEHEPTTAIERRQQNVLVGICISVLEHHYGSLSSVPLYPPRICACGCRMPLRLALIIVRSKQRQALVAARAIGQAPPAIYPIGHSRHVPLQLPLLRRNPIRPYRVQYRSIYRYVRPYRRRTAFVGFRRVQHL